MKESIPKTTKVLKLQLRHCEVNNTGSIYCMVSTYSMIRVAVDTSKTEEFIKECIIAKRFIHPNVMSLIGVSYIKEEAVPLMILPFMYNGDVKSFVKSKRGNEMNFIKVTEFPKVVNALSCFDCHS